MKTIKTILAALVMTIGSFTIANAQTRVHVSVNTPGVHISAGNYRPVHRVYYERPVVYHRYYSRPVVYRPVYHRYYGRPVAYRTTYHRTVYAGPAYHRVYRRY